jgi:8-oxo-dGTP diphosphatase
MLDADLIRLTARSRMLLTSSLRSRVPDEYLFHPRVSLALIRTGEAPGSVVALSLCSREVDLQADVRASLAVLCSHHPVATPEFVVVCCYLEPHLRYHTVDFVFKASCPTAPTAPLVRDGQELPIGPVESWVLQVCATRDVPVTVHEHPTISGPMHVGHNEYYRRLRRYVGHDLIFSLGSGAFVSDGERVLLQRRRDSGRWGMPGGSLEVGERLADAAVREVKEETGFDVAITGLGSILTGPECSIVYPHGDRMRFLSFSFDAVVTGGAAVRDTEETVDVGWFALDNLPCDLGPIARKHLELRGHHQERPVLG